MTTSRHNYSLTIFEKLGTPLLTAVAEATERDRLYALQQGQKLGDPSDHEEAERLANLLKSSAELGLALSRQIDLRMVDDTVADGVRLTLATIAAPLIANLYRVNGRAPSSQEIDRMTTAMQTVTLFADQYNAAADANVRLQSIEFDFAPADGPQVQLMTLQALMPAVNAVCTFAFGQPEKDLLQQVMDRLTMTARSLRSEFWADLPERDGLRAEIALIRAAANVYMQAHFTEMSKLMFLEDNDRDRVDLKERLNDLWGIVDKRLAMIGVVAQGLAGSAPRVQAGGGRAASPAPTSATAVPAATGGPFAGFTKPAVTPSAPVANTPVQTSDTAADTGQKASPMSFFTKPKEASGGTT